MAAVHGKGGKVFINGHHLSAWFDSYDIQLNMDTAEKSVFQNTDKTYNAGMKDGTISLTGFFDATADAADEVLYTAVGTSVVWNIYPSGDAVASSGYGLEGNNNAYGVMGTKDDNVRIAATGLGGLERVISLCPLTAVTTTAVGTAVDNTAATTSGGSAFLQVTTATGSCGVIVEHSSAGGSYATLATFTAFTTAQGVRKAITGEIKSLTRVSYSGNMTLQCSIHRE
jgi:hypothetical protein